MGRIDEQLVGLWTAIPYPTSETRLAFFPDGRGLLWYYWGSVEGTPLLDTFTWELREPGVLHIHWQVVHGWGDSEEDEDAGSEEELDNFFLCVYTDREEQCPFTLTTTDGRRSLDLWIGLHTGMENPLSYTRPLRTYDEERAWLAEEVTSFDPFGPGRQCWLVDDDGWQPLPEVEIAEEAPTAISPSAIIDHLLPGSLLLMIIGTFALVGNFSEVVQHRLPAWLAVGLHIVPVGLLALLRSDEELGSKLARWTRGLRTLAAGWYTALVAFMLATMVIVPRPRAWWLFLAMALLGMLPCVQMWRERRQGRSTINGRATKNAG